MKISTWNKPNSNEVRVYFNGLYEASSNGIKVFAVKSDDRFEIRFTGMAYSSTKDAILNTIDTELEEMNGGERVNKWEQLINLCK